MPFGDLYFFIENISVPLFSVYFGSIRCLFLVQFYQYWMNNLSHFVVAFILFCDGISEKHITATCPVLGDPGGNSGD